MKDKKDNLSTGHGVTFWEALAITFIILKLTNVITFECDKHGVVLDNMIGKTINFSIKANKNKDTSPLSLEYMIEILDGVPKNVVDNAMAEHDVYLSMRKQYG